MLTPSDKKNPSLSSRFYEPLSPPILKFNVIAKMGMHTCSFAGAVTAPTLATARPQHNVGMMIRCAAGTDRNGQGAANTDRREALVTLFAAVGAQMIAPANSIAAEDVPAAVATDAPSYSHLVEPTLAYEFDYPAVTATGRKLPLVFSRRPERYSSAAPLTADARQRIVCELADLINAVTVSVSVGPPAGTLRVTTPEQWTPKQVAEQVLVDRSTARITSGQRVSLNVVEQAKVTEKDGFKYYIYEHVSQGSPTMSSGTRETYRHAIAVTAARPGLDGSLFLYTMNLACPQEKWEELEAAFAHCAESFTLLSTPGADYVAPDADPWRFF